MTRDPQQIAADPRLSIFVTANAGSGKTKTLIDRVARLLLTGAEPETILCVTYTKAAAAEMQRRLYSLLGDWSVLDDAKLREVLGRLEGLEPATYDGPRLSSARGLFARALETPGGLKIQTIHAFCEKLLKRFPLEAGVSPNFQVADDTASSAIATAARKTVARLSMQSAGAVSQAYARLSVALDFQAFQTMFSGFEGTRAAIKAYFATHGGRAGAVADLWQVCGFQAPTDPEAIEDAALGALDLGLWRRCAAVLALGTKTDQSCAEKMLALVSAPSWESALAALFNSSGDRAPATWVARTSGFKAHPDLREKLLAEQEALDAARARARAARVAGDTADVLALAEAYLVAYDLEKASYGVLDFADLIEKTRDLVATSPQAAWVLYKLDGGIDHILVDEAQDTAPDQWAIVRSLAEEFYSGAGAGGARDRDLFVVGDEKQSIYSFQGARPELLIAEFEHHRQRATAAGFGFERVDLLTSWRSSPQILAFVDAVFADPALSQAILPREVAEPIVHKAGHHDRAGCVDIWKLVPEPGSEDQGAWDAPLDQESDLSANKVLARQIAREIKALIARGDGVVDKDSGKLRPATAGDVLILVRRRKGLFEEILRALKQANVPVAGADRLALSGHILFDDLVAVARFALFPADDLSLAEVLRSPFFDLDDDSLYGLAKGRKVSLADTLAARASERPEWTEAADRLNDICYQAGRLAPFEFYAYLLGLRDLAGQSMRQRLIHRLGSEADDALDAFLDQVLAAEARGVRDLEALAAAFANLDITVKREMEAGRDEVRVMTAHGAKGLEAPIVILPETTLTATARGSSLLQTRDGGLLWSTSKANDNEPAALAREERSAREAAEAYRLLYVALTRARDRLILCGRQPPSSRSEPLKGWWGAIGAALEGPKLAGQVRDLGEGARRVGPDPLPAKAGAASLVQKALLPPWIGTQAGVEPFARYVSPSRLGADFVGRAASPLARISGLGRFRRGNLIHRLLQILPDLEPGTWNEASRQILAREVDLDANQRLDIQTAALGLLEDKSFGEVFGPGSRPEVAVVGGARTLPPGLAISGRVDRLVVTDGRVLVVDFKTNQPSPDRVDTVSPAYLRQMAIYVAVLSEIFPDHRVEAALVWTDGAKLMPIPEILIAQTLDSLARDG